MKNYKLAREALANDCHLVGNYVGPIGSARTCAIGRLAIMSGVTREELRPLNNIPIISRRMIAVRNAIASKFGLNMIELSLIQEANDCYADKLDSSITERQKDVLKVLDNIHQHHENKS